MEELQGNVQRPYFLCPLTEAFCNQIYFDEPLWASREAHRIQYNDDFLQKGLKMAKIRAQLIGTDKRDPARGKRRQEAKQAAHRELARLKLVPNSWWDLEPVINADIRDRAAKLKQSLRSVRNKDTTLEWAIQNGKASMEQWPHFGPSPESPSSLMRRLATQTPRMMAVLEEQPSIRIDTLMSRGWLDDGRLTFWHLGWAKELTSGIDILLVVDCRVTGQKQVRLQFSGGSLIRPVEQKILIAEHQHTPARKYFRCPSTGKNCLELFLRDGFFASAKVQRIDYRSRMPRR